MSTSREDRIAALPAHLREQLLRRLAGASGPAEEPGIPTVPRTGPLPMSFAQQRLWFLHELDPESVGYNSCFGLRLTGELDAGALREALVGVVRRHEALRTTFDSVDGTPVQTPCEEFTVPFEQVDLSGPAGADRQAELDRAVARDLARPFDLRTGPLLRALLVRLAEREHVLVLTLHHINHDGWSMSVVTREIGELYRAGREGRAADLAPVPLQYADFAVWQREQCSPEALAPSLAYWREQLAGLSPLELPADRPRPAVRTSGGDVESVLVPSGVADGLRSLSRRCGATLFMTLTAAAQVLLARWTGQRDVAVGTPVAGRGHPGLEEVVGFFLNTLVLRARLDPDRSFTELLAGTRESVLEAFQHEEVPFEQVVDAVQPERDAGRMPLAQVLVVLQNAPEAQLELSGLGVEQYRLPQASTGFDLVLGFEERSDGSLGVDVEYSGDLFDATTVRRLCGHLVTLLGSIAAAPDLPWTDLALLTDEEHRRLTVDWARTPAPDLDDVGVHELIARHAAEHPGAVAVECGDQRLTYGELDRRSGELARHLIASGVAPGSVVGICLDRGPDLVVATLAALRTGSAFLPLNAAFPPARRELMLTETAAPVVLTQRSLLGDFANTAVRAVAVDGPWPGAGAGADTGEEPRVGSEALAYVIYTSGSTGTPKGVLLRHRGLVNMVTATARRFGLGVGGRVLQLSSPSFDGAVWETFLALTSGATLCLPEAGVEAIGPELVVGLAKGEPVLLSLPPAALAALDPADLAAGSTVLAVGDRCPVELARSWSGRHRFVNGYGPTEATVGAALFEGEIPADAARLPIGRPIAGVEVYVLDERLRPVPVGVTGELFIGGRGVARGYLGRPELTGQRFVRHPFSDDPDARLYRTGDLGAWLPGGELDFRGRTDDQVKIRGFRIELGEIETAMGRLAGVDQACALALDHGGRKQLVGYLVPVAGQTLDPGRVHDELSALLPEFMVPSAFAVLDRLPLTAHGKVDRRALAERPVTARREHVAPRTDREEVLAEIFRTVLGVERVGVHDAFFDLGGDSILSTQVVSRARQAGLELTVKELFQARTVARLAELVRTADASGADQGGQPDAGPVPLTPVQHWFFETHTANPHHFNQSVLLELAPDADPAAVRAALAAVVARHDALRLRFTRTDGQWRQEVVEHPDGRWHFTHLDLSGTPEEQLSERIDAAVLAAQTGLSVTDGPLLRAALFTLADRPPRLFLTAHHLAVDGVSWRVLLDDLRIGYGQLSAGKDVDLGPLSTSFGQWARRLERFTAEGGFDDQAEYWRAATADAPAVPDPGLVEQARTVHGRLTAEETDALLRRVPGAHRARINEVLLAALGRSLTGWTGRDRTLVELEGHGREDFLDGVELSRTVGWFTAAHPLALAVPADAPMSAAVRTVKRQLRAVPQHGIGYGALRHLAADRPGHPRPARVRALVGFNYLGQWDTAAAGDGLVVRPLPHGGAEHHPAEHRAHPLDVVGAVEEGRMEFSCTYPAGHFTEESVTELLTGMLDGLRELVRATP
ncbi:amino acid adenylation domain-containing protein [Kitasatospora aureofaciens]|uniref:amino acid adenylation domain-containing protein n=1 Tax=Kitasatospora aureofaciens TaxID=1894 RepID=UPI003411F4DD